MIGRASFTFTRSQVIDALAEYYGLSIPSDAQLSVDYEGNFNKALITDNENVSPLMVEWIIRGA